MVAMNMKMFKDLDDAVVFMLNETKDGNVTSMKNIKTGEETFVVEYNYE